MPFISVESAELCWLLAHTKNYFQPFFFSSSTTYDFLNNKFRAQAWKIDFTCANTQTNLIAIFSPKNDCIICTFRQEAEHDLILKHFFYGKSKFNSIILTIFLFCNIRWNCLKKILWIFIFSNVKARVVSRIVMLNGSVLRYFMFHTRFLLWNSFFTFPHIVLTLVSSANRSWKEKNFSHIFQGFHVQREKYEKHFSSLILHFFFSSLFSACWIVWRECEMWISESNNSSCS